jgi:glucosamine-6-phosphate deaminase
LGENAMKLIIRPTKEEMGALAAKHAAKLVNEAIEKRGYARILLSTGASQFPFFKEFVKENIDWSKVEMFHLDEYVGISEEHPASFKRYLLDRFVNVVNPGEAHLINGLQDPSKTIEELTAIVREKPVDVGLIGIGENGHIAFNDPPADFDDERAYKVVTLDERCLKQQVGEGWFKSVEETYKQAISMTCNEIMKCRSIISVVPYAVKADAIYETVTNDLTPNVPATLLKQHPDCTIYCDADSSSRLTDAMIEKAGIERVQ